MHWLLRALGLGDATAAERRATVWVAVMFGCALASTFLLRPLRDQFGVDQGVARMPHLYGLTLLATLLAAPPFWWLANRMPSRRFVPIALQAVAAALLLLFLGLCLVGDYDWQAAPWLGEWFWGGYSAANVVVPTLVWIHAVEHFRRAQALRLFGLIGVGGTLGAVIGSFAAGLLSQQLQLSPRHAALASFALLQGAFFAYRRSLPACTAMRGVEAAAPERISAGGVFAGLWLVLRDGRLRAIAGYMVLLGMLATAFYAAQTELVGAQVGSARGQHVLLANVEFLSQSLVLLLQLFCTGRLLRRLPTALFLVALPLLSIAGLGALWLWPLVATVALVQILRRGAQFAFEKPAREVLYTPLDIETKHKAKFLLDTFAFRLGDLFGAVLQVALRRHELGGGAAAGATIALALAWAGLGAWLGARTRSVAAGAGESPDPAVVPRQG